MAHSPLTKHKVSKACVICKQQVTGHGHNARPVASGRCCDACNGAVVLARRLKEIQANDTPDIDSIQERNFETRYL